MPRSSPDPEASPALSQTGEESVQSRQPSRPKPAAATPDSLNPPEYGREGHTRQLSAEDLPGSPSNRVESHSESMAPAVTETTRPGWVAIQEQRQSAAGGRR